MAERRVTVKVDLQAGGNLAQVAGAAAAQVAKVQAATKGATAAAANAAAANAGYGGFGSYLPAAQAPVPGSAWAAGANANVLRRGIPVAQFAPPTARHWMEQDTLREAGQKRIGDAEQRLAYLRSGPGQAATIRALQAETALARQQDNLARVAKLGAAGAALDRFAERAEPVARGLRNIGIAGDALMYGSITSVSPAASSQINNSFRMIANEIGIAVIPSAVRFTGTLQQVARGVRATNEATNGWAGTLAFTGVGLATVAAVGNTLFNVGRSVVANAGALARAAGLAGQLGGPALTGAAGAGGTIGGGALTTGVGGTGIGVAGIATIAVAAVSAELGRANIVGNIIRDRGGFAANAQRSPAQYALDVAQFLVAPAAYLPVRALTGALTSGEPANVSETTPTIYRSAEDMLDALTMRVAGTPGPIAEQETRAMSEWIAAINRNTAAVAAVAGVAEQGQNWGPPAGENG